MTEYFSYDEDLNYTPDGLVQGQGDDVSTPQEDPKIRHGSPEPRPIPLECYGCGEQGSYEKFGIPTKCPKCGSLEVHLDLEKNEMESEMVHKQIEDPFAFGVEEWEHKFKESMKRVAQKQIKKSSIVDNMQESIPYKDPHLQLNAPNVMDQEDGLEGGPFGSKGVFGAEASKKPEWFSFYASDPGNNDNPGTDEDHNSTDTDDVEEDRDQDYGGKNRRNHQSDSNTATLVAMGGIGAIPKFAGEIPEGKHGDHDIVYGDDEEEISSK